MISGLGGTVQIATSDQPQIELSIVSGRLEQWTSCTEKLLPAVWSLLCIPAPEFPRGISSRNTPTSCEALQSRTYIVISVIVAPSGSRSGASKSINWPGVLPVHAP